MKVTGARWWWGFDAISTCNSKGDRENLQSKSGDGSDTIDAALVVKVAGARLLWDFDAISAFNSRGNRENLQSKSEDGEF